MLGKLKKIYNIYFELFSNNLSTIKKYHVIIYNKTCHLVIII